MKNPLIALLTDFGNSDYFVGSLKGVILSINPVVRLVDITHQVDSFDVFDASFILYASACFFPKETIFLSVVDPGVGSSRKIILVRTQKHYFISPDNGLLTLVLDKEKPEEIREVNNPVYFLEETSSTFEARDKMASVAAWVSLGISTSEFGPECHRFVKLNYRKPVQTNNQITGSIIYVDKFGNGITDIKFEWFDQLRQRFPEKKIILQVKERKIAGFSLNYTSGPDNEVFFLQGSLGYLEVALKKGSASLELNFKPKDEVILYLED